MTRHIAPLHHSSLSCLTTQAPAGAVVTGYSCCGQQQHNITAPPCNSCQRMALPSHGLLCDRRCLRNTVNTSAAVNLATHDDWSPIPLSLSEPAQTCQITCQPRQKQDTSAYSCGVCMSSVTSCVGGGWFLCFTCLHVPYSTVTLITQVKSGSENPSHTQSAPKHTITHTLHVRLCLHCLLVNSISYQLTNCCCVPHIPPMPYTVHPACTHPAKPYTAKLEV
jgi:hypothetical protein